MSYLEALLYGLIQGVTEYLPISSSAHLILLPKFLQNEDPGLAFDVFLHLGTLFATLIYFRRDWMNLLRPSQLRVNLTRNEGLSLKILIIATIPALIAGAVLHSAIQTTFRGEGVVVVTLALGGVLLYLADRFSPGARTIDQLRLKDAIGVGLFQCLALVPGMSRSGSTMTGARILGLDRQTAARFSFLMSAPITGAAVVFELRHFEALFQSSIGIGPLLTAGISSFLFGWLTIDLLLKVLRRISFLGFAVYRVGLALVVYLLFRPF